MAENPEERVVLISPLKIDKNGELRVIQGINNFHETLKCGLFYRVRTGLFKHDDEDSDEEDDFGFEEEEIEEEEIEEEEIEEDDFGFEDEE